MGTLYFQTTGAATNSGSSDNNSADLSGSAASVAASIVTLDGSPDLSGVSTSGATQAAIYLAQATNSNQKVFWITAVDNTLKTVTVSVAPTGVTSSGWAIGGRMVWTPANFEAAVRAGDILQINDSPAARTTTFLTCRVNGDSTSGNITLRGKAGVRPVLNVTNTSVVITGNSATNWTFNNLEADQDGASGNAISGFGVGCWFDNIKVSDAGGIGINSGSSSARITGCEVANVGSVGISFGIGTFGQISGCYVHDCAGDGIVISGANPTGAILDTIVDTCAGNGINLSGASTTQGHCATIRHCTVYGCTGAGLIVADADTVVDFKNNAFSENAAGNVTWSAGTAELVSSHGYNVFYKSSGTNLTNVTANGTEFTTDPLFTDAAGGNFAIGNTSPAAGAGFPGQFLGGSVGYPDIGAVQRAVTGGGGVTGSRIILGM